MTLEGQGQIDNFWSFYKRKLDRRDVGQPLPGEQSQAGLIYKAGYLRITLCVEQTGVKKIAGREPRTNEALFVGVTNETF